jgi:hypothetical protein
VSRELTDDKARQHDWKRYEGEVDIFAMEYEWHNGPMCKRCHESFCHHCEPDCYRYICPETEVQ